jgi:hypothetical protein
MLGRPMTRSFAAVERFFERLLERPAARLFRAPIQPEQLQRKLERAMEGGRVSKSDRTYVPNRFRVLLHPADLAQFEEERTILQADLADAILRRARVRGYRLVARPEVLVVPSERVGEGEVEVLAEALDPGLVRSAASGLRQVEPEAPRPPTPPIPGTAEMPAVPADLSGNGHAPATTLPTDGPASFIPVAPPPPASPMAPPPAPAVPGPVASSRPVERIAALIEIRSRNGQPWAFVFRGGVVRIGRGTDNEIVLPDDRVSRRHGQLTSRQGTLVYTDLGSSNGSQVNGAPAREIALGVGDVVRVGNSTLTIRPGG